MINRFKKDVAYYLLGIIIPGGMNFLAIPVFKNMLGETAYGQFSLLFTALLICNAALVGWICQSIIRVGVASDDKQKFMSYSLGAAFLVSGVAALLSVPLLLYWNLSLLMALFFAAVLVMTSVQTTLVAISQASFRVRLTVYTEALRVAAFFMLGFCILFFTGNDRGVEKLFAAVGVSSAISAMIHLYGNRLFEHITPAPEWDYFRKVASALFHYGIFLMLWFLLNYAVNYWDRYLIAYAYGKQLAGNYSAVFDLIARSIALLGTPVMSAILPILVEEFEKGNRPGIEELMQQVLLAEFAALAAAALAYWWFGYDLLCYLLKLPAGNEGYFWAGLFVIIGSFAGQFGMLLHKRLELAKETRVMVYCVAVSFVVGLIAGFALVGRYGIVGTSFAYFSATACYALLVNWQGHLMLSKAAYLKIK